VTANFATSGNTSGHPCLGQHTPTLRGCEQALKFFGCQDEADDKHNEGSEFGETRSYY
jgi:hypothetical protein